MTNSRIVIGIDGSQQARTALRWAVREADRRGARLEVVSAWRYPWVPAPLGDPMIPAAVEAISDACRQTLDETVDSVLAETGSACRPDRVVVEATSIGAAVVDEAEGADLLVVGQRGGGGFLGLRLGSVSEYCLDHATSPVAIIPDTGFGDPQRVVVGVDGSASSLAALAVAAREAELRAVPLVALLAWTWLGQPIGDSPLHETGFTEEKALELLESILAGVEVAVPVAREVVNDLAARPLIEHSGAGDLVVLGAHGHTGLRARLAGSVSRQVAHHAHAPLLVVR